MTTGTPSVPATENTQTHTKNMNNAHCCSDVHLIIMTSPPSAVRVSVSSAGSLQFMRRTEAVSLDMNWL